MTKSILYSDATINHDRKIVGALVDEVVAGDDAHKSRCVDKIMDAISDQAWQAVFPQRYFVFCVYYGIGVSITEIRSSFYFQAVDALYPYLVEPHERNELNFQKKIKRIFARVYGHDMPNTTSQAIRILRNRVVHAGTILGNGLYPEDDEKLEAFIKQTYNSGSQQLTMVQGIMHFAGSTTFLIAEMVIRVLGLRWDDLSRNLLPPSRSLIFCKEADLHSTPYDFELIPWRSGA